MDPLVYDEEQDEEDEDEDEDQVGEGELGSISAELAALSALDDVKQQHPASRSPGESPCCCLLLYSLILLSVA
jgi:hypothetical protein